MSLNKCFFSLVIVVSLQCGGVVCGITPVTKFPITIRENNSNHEVVLTLNSTSAPYDAELYTGLDNCVAHKTKAGRKFEHVHINFSLPKTGVIKGTTTSKTVTLLNIRVLYDWKYVGYTRSGAEDITRNCHGYAFGINTWVNSTAELDADNLVSVTSWCDTEILRNGNIHSILVDKSKTKIGRMGCTIRTSEKDGESAIYEQTWGWSSPSSASSKYKFKP
jgi:hypothetical protein